MNYVLLDLYQRLQKLPDARRTTSGHYLHEQASMIVAVFLAVVNNRTGYRAYSDYIEDNLKILQAYLYFPHGTPSPDTIRRVINSVDSTMLSNIMRDWSGINTLDPQYLQADGKCIRATRSDDGSACHIVTLYASECMASLLEVEVDEKANEITAFKTIVNGKKVNFKGKVVTGDAMYCQKCFCRAIHEAGGDYVFVLKGNQPSMLKDVQLFMADLKECDTKQVVKKGHGRLVVKNIRFTTDVEWLTEIYDFPGLQSLAEITTTVTEKGKTSTGVMYLISSLSSLDELFAARERHWGIESMHWILDTSFDEDYCRARSGHAALNFNIMRKTGVFLLNLANVATFSKFKGMGIKRILARCSNAFHNLLIVLTLVRNVAAIFDGQVRGGATQSLMRI